MTTTLNVQSNTIAAYDGGDEAMWKVYLYSEVRGRGQGHEVKGPTHQNKNKTLHIVVRHSNPNLLMLEVLLNEKSL